MGSLLCDSLEPRQAKRLQDADLDLLPSSARQGPLFPVPIFRRLLAKAATDLLFLLRNLFLFTPAILRKTQFSSKVPVNFCRHSTNLLVRHFTEPPGFRFFSEPRQESVNRKWRAKHLVTRR